MDNFRGKKLLILAGAGVHNKVVIAAKEMGIYTIVTDFLIDSPAKKIADEAWLIDIMDVDSIVAKCKEENIDGILAFCIDPAQKPYQEICERLGLPCYGTYNQFDILTNKRKFKDFCIINGVDVVPEYTIDDINQDRVEYPILIKPSDSRGSRGQTICHGKKDTINAILLAKKESSDEEIIIEKYMGDYQDAAFSYIVIGGEPYLLKIGDRIIGREEDNMNTQVLLTVLPSNSTEMYIKRVNTSVCNMIKALCIKFGPVFIQGFIDKENEKVYFYDPGMRFPGGDYDLILNEATGFDTVKTLIRFALTGDTKVAIGDPEKAYLLNDSVAALITISVKPGKIEKVKGFDELREHSNIIYARQIIDEGTLIPNSGDVRQRIAAFGAIIPERGHIYDIIKDVYSTYHVFNDNGENMIIKSLLYWKE